MCIKTLSEGIDSVINEIQHIKSLLDAVIDNHEQQQTTVDDKTSPK